MAELKCGQFESGFLNYEARFEMRNGTDCLEAIPNCPRWDGRQRRAGMPLLLVAEQGLGDTFQFMRYAIPLRQQRLQVSLCAPQKLHGLIQASGIDPLPLTPDQARQVGEGYWAPLLSVPRLLGVSPQNPIITHPYISTTPDLIEKWKTILANEPRPLIGINWQGNPAHEKTNNVGRSLPLDAFSALAAKTNGAFISLQKGYGAEQLDTCSFRDHFVTCQQQISDTWDFLEISAIIANCDLVMTSDTSVAHLAAGMGQKVYMLLKKHPEWRWLLDGESTFWYPSMKLIRQSERGDWAGVIDRVLKDFLA
jgi:hypothetical protein